jgi:MarR family transcriptional regulator, organic hydroperoxide resistance regulator
VLDATGQRPSTLTGILDRLERAGLIERTPNPRDRRSVLLGLTADGAKAAARVARAFEEVAARLPERDVRRALAAAEAALDSG